MRIAAAALAGLGLLAPISAARADLYVRWPTVDYREFEFEHNGLVAFGKPGSDFDRAQSYTNAVGMGVLPFWEVELEGEMEAGPNQNLVMNAVTLENTFQLTPPGEYEFNLGLYAEYSRSLHPPSSDGGEPGSVTFGPIVQKELPDFLDTDSVHTLNLFVTHDTGPGATHATGLDYAWQSLLYVTPLLSPAVELYGTIPDMAHAGHVNQQQTLAGPVLTGVAHFGRWGAVRYQAGYLFGLTSGSPRGAVRWQVEYELAF